MGINLTATDQSLEVGTSTAVAVTVVASFKDKTTSAETPGSQQTNISSIAETAVVSAPSASTQRQVEDVEILVTGSGSNNVIVQKDVASTEFPVLNVLLGTGERAHFTSAFGWRVFDTFGREKVTVGYSQLAATTILTAGTSTLPPLGATAVLIQGWAGGGGGGGAQGGTAANSAGGGGGASGGYFECFVIGVPSTINYTIGALGGGGSTGGGNGSTGGDTTCTINGSVLTAKGGLGGIGMTQNTTQRWALGGAPGTISTCSPSLPGFLAGFGDNGDNSDVATGLLGVSGKGASSTLGVGNGGAGRTTSGTGNAATGVGAGGGGGLNLNNGGSFAGGAGTVGQIAFTYFTG